MRSSRFAPWVLLGCLLFVANCGKDKTVPASGAVGHVVVVKGEVTAQRAGETIRPVRVDDTVYADDTITTGAEASVEILLTHNGALWELGESAKRRIDKGIAFRATKKGAGPLAAKEAATTAAAGRSTTREAADSVGTVVGFEADDDSDEEAKEEAQDEPLREQSTASADLEGGEGTEKADSAGEPRGGKGDVRRGSGRRASSTRNKDVGMPPDAPRRPMAKPAPKTTSQPPPPAPGAVSTSSNEEPAEEAMPATEAARDDGAGGSADNDAGDDGEAAPDADNRPKKAKKQISPQARQISHVDALVRKCHKTHGGSGTLGYAISANGALKVTRSNASLGPVVQCLRSALKANPAPNKTAVTSTLRLE